MPAANPSLLNGCAGPELPDTSISPSQVLQTVCIQTHIWHGQGHPLDSVAPESLNIVSMQLKSLYTLSGKIVEKVRQLAEPDARWQIL